MSRDAKDLHDNSSTIKKHNMLNDDSITSPKGWILGNQYHDSKADKTSFTARVNIHVVVIRNAKTPVKEATSKDTRVARRSIRKVLVPDLDFWSKHQPSGCCASYFEAQSTYRRQRPCRLSHEDGRMRTRSLRFKSNTSKDLLTTERASSMIGIAEIHSHTQIHPDL